MEGVFIVAMVLGGIVLALAVIGGTILMAIKIIRGDFSGGYGQQTADEARMVQEIYQGMSRLEERLESLETILLDKDKRESTHEKN
ncbi:MAG: phage-shock protein [Desulfobacteraceae bacterium]|nr:MAG: phage-shock protein [Desulfobacteraceae bacterium]